MQRKPPLRMAFGVVVGNVAFKTGPWQSNDCQGPSKLSLQFRNNPLQVLLCAMEIGQGTTQEFVPQEESDGRDIDAFVQKLHGEGMPAVESDMLVNTGRLY